MLCYLQELRDKHKNISDRAFMGYTHALSGVAMTLLLIAFFPEFLSKVLFTSNAWVFCLFIMATTGAAMLPDLDNSASRAKSDLGPFGVILSSVFRTTSVIAQTTIRTKRDSDEPNPHRGLWHTIPASLLLGFLVYLGTQIGGKVDLPLLGEKTWGTVFALFITFVLIHLTLSTLAKEFLDKIKKSGAMGELVAIAISIITSVGLFLMLPENLNFWWLGVSVAFGMFVHLFFDSATTAGSPLLFPLSYFIHGKFWWTTSFTKMKAGSAAENMLVVPIFTIIIIVSLGKIVLGLF